ncbi:hypothetical protein BD289DRAFT_445054 [Coniella lustricola]|uniref:Mitochondrial intermediate peptidase n=1 Tax=Coniella lustricola TaxID=2025994 RepID=A0A2T2ZV97_9PEZI|nr:hypothetical protein BD289DRAFT_445054 [Coniella lustricola]
MIRLARPSPASASVRAPAALSTALSSSSPLQTPCRCAASSLGMRRSACDAARRLTPRQSRRLQHTAAASAATATTTTTTTTSSSSSSSSSKRPAKSILAAIADRSTSTAHDDATLRKIFDSNAAWLSFSQESAQASHNVGLFRNAYLTDPQGFLVFAHVSLERAKSIVDKILHATSELEYRQVVRDMDRLSDILCRVIDLADFVRNTHPKHSMQAAASQAWASVYEYMNLLNTTNGLNEQLGKAMSMPKVYKSWTEEERTVAEILRLDFTKSAVNLPKEARDKFIQLSSEIGEVGQDFVDNASASTDKILIPSANLQGVDPKIISKSINRNKEAEIHPLGPEAQSILRNTHNEHARKQVYIASRTASPATIDRLERMLKLRAELADLAGFSSYSHMALRDRMMAKNPEAVWKFLTALLDSNKPLVQREMQDLVAMKKTNKGSNKHFQAWDKDYYMDSIRRAARSMAKYEDSLSAYFSLGTVMQGLSRLFTRLYGIRFVPRETLPGETWARDVRRLDVVSDTDGHVAVLYCDLFFRPGKAANPAHFTVRCSREIQPHELHEATAQLSHDRSGTQLPHFATAEEAANDGMALARDQDGVLKQLPTIALVCDFPHSSNSSSGDKPAFLTFGQLETLFHEMGHAIHSILARTSLHNVSGTRCATDLAELPSTLMEQFCADRDVLALFARHWSTDQPLDFRMVVEQLQKSRLFAGIDTEHQILLAMLDQQYHSPRVAQTPDFNSTRVYQEVQRRYGNTTVDNFDTTWQGFFGHLYGYGSSYYSYLFDRVLADRVWDTVFQSGRDGAAVSRENGERLKENLLKHGGGRDAWQCLADTLQDDRLAKGDHAAMALVGSWGTGPCFRRS